MRTRPAPAPLVAPAARASTVATAPRLALLAGALAALAPAAPTLAQHAHGYEPHRIAIGRPLVSCLEEDLGFDPHLGCGKACMLRARFAAGLPPYDPQEHGPAEALGDTDVLRKSLEIEVFPATTSLAGTNVIRARSLKEGLTEFTFRLRNQYAVTGPGGANTVLLDGRPVPVTNLSTSSWRVAFDRPYALNEEFTLSISYSGVAVSRGFGSIEFRTQGGQPIVATLSQPYWAYTWWPVKDGDVFTAGDNSDKFALDISIISPSNLNSYANGALQGVDTLPNNRVRYRYKSEYLTPTYLVAFGTTNYNRWTVPWTYGTTTMPVDFAIYPNSDTPANRAAWQLSVGQLTTFSNLFGLYPFADEKYGIYQFPFGGGMEHQTGSGQGGFGESLTAHELAHQWWGDWVTCKTWQDIWLNEGFATYSECLWQEFKPGSTGLPALQAALNARRPSNTNAAGTVYVPASSMNDMNRIFSTALSYQKGAWALHQLRGIVGTPTFFDILDAHRAAHAGSSATTDDFKNVASAVAGTDLSWYFNQSVYGAGLPGYASGFTTRTVNNTTYLLLRVRQTQNNASFGVNGVFSFPIDVRTVTGANGAVNAKIWNNALTEHYVIPLGTPTGVSSVTIDPDVWILNSGRASETFVAGPAAVVETIPAPDTSVPAAGAPDRVRVFFSGSPIFNRVSDYAVTRQSTGGPVAVPFTVELTDQFERTLNFGAPLAPGVYTVTVRDTVGGDTPLDGERTTPGSVGYYPGGLPSGDGQPGGNCVFSFTVVAPPCAPDLNNDGELTFDDIQLFVALFNAADPRADFNADGEWTFDDVQAFIAAFNAGC